MSALLWGWLLVSWNEDAVPESLSERTEQPTPSRRRELRRQGQVARSADLAAAVVLFGAALGLLALGGRVTGKLVGRLTNAMQQRDWLPLEPRRLDQHVVNHLGEALMVLIPFLLLVVVGAVAANLLQVGPVFAPGLVKPRLGRRTGRLGQLLSWEGLVEAVLTLIKVVAIVAVTALILYDESARLGQMGVMSSVQMAEYVGSVLPGTAVRLSFALCTVGLADFAFQWWRRSRHWRITPFEWRQEQREVEGDPLARHRRRDTQRLLIQQRAER